MGLRAYLLILALLPCATAHAADNVLIWGIQDRCERVPELDKTLDRMFNKGGLNTWVLSPAPSVCQGADCAKRLLSQCPAASGRLIGGRIYRNKKTVRLRLWMYDMATHKTAYQDAICLDCLLSTLVPNQAQYLWERHKWGQIPGPTPTFCQDRAPAAAPELPWGRKLYLMVYGDGKQKHLVTAAMRELLAKSARPVQVVSGEKGPNHTELAKIVGPAKDGKVVGIETLKEGGATLWLYDGPTGKMQQQSIECPSCEADAMNEVLKNNVIPLLAHCFEDDCKLGTSEPLPTGSCEPLEEPTCHEEELVAPVALSGPGIDPTVAGLVKGGLWGLFTASAASSIGLFTAGALQPGVSGQYSESGSLNRVGWATASFAALTLAIAIPTTYYISRNKPAVSALPVPGAATSVPASSQMRCPQ